MKVQLWHSTISGALYGLIIGIAAQIAREIHFEYEKELIAQEFYPWSPPNLVDMLQPHVIPVAFSVAFAALGSFIYLLWMRRQ